MERDIQLDCYRALAMIYIVCVIHIFYLFEIGDEVIKSVLLFEMPVIFFIAGASQSYKNNHYLKKMLASRIKRVLIPYYIFLLLLLTCLAVCTVFGTTFHGDKINITNLSMADIIKMLMTGGCTKIPYLGYTWFISCYFIISCSLPVQKKIIDKMPRHLYILITLAIFIVWRILDIKSPEEIIERVLCYNFFYIAGFLYYKKLSQKLILKISILPIIVSIYLLASAKLFPMQAHKFPPDMLFLTYSLAVLCILGLIFEKIKIKENHLIKIWNTRGYSIYLYQSISFFIVYKLLENPIKNIENNVLLFTIYSISIFIVATTLSYGTFHIEGIISSALGKIIKK